MADFYVYILVSEVNRSLYTGQTQKLRERLELHNKGKVNSTKSKRPFRIGYVETYKTRSEAMYREWQLKKQWNTDRKKRLLNNFVLPKSLDLR